MSYTHLDAPTDAALNAYVDALYRGSTELVAIYAAVSAWLTYHPNTLVDDARETIRALVNPPESAQLQNVVRLRG